MTSPGSAGLRADAADLDAGEVAAIAAPAVVILRALVLHDANLLAAEVLDDLGAHRGLGDVGGADLHLVAVGEQHDAVERQRLAGLARQARDLQHLVLLGAHLRAVDVQNDVHEIGISSGAGRPGRAASAPATTRRRCVGRTAPDGNFYQPARGEVKAPPGRGTLRAMTRSPSRTRLPGRSSRNGRTTRSPGSSSRARSRARPAHG